MSAEGIKLFAEAMEAMQSAQIKLCALATKKTESSILEAQRQDYRLGALMQKAKDSVAEEFSKETTR